jgi:hypothetical protein
MNKSIRATTFAFILLTWCHPATSRSQDARSAEQTSYPETWSPRLLALTKAPTLVAEQSTGTVHSLAFRGDAPQFQSFLDQCLELGAATPTTLHFHYGKGTLQPLTKGAKAIPCDWRLDVVNKNAAGEPKYSLELHLWDPGTVDLRKLKLPAELWEKRVSH